MSGAAFDCQVRDGEITIFLPGTNYRVIYLKPADSPRLFAKEFPMKVDRRAPITQARFLALAWKLANDKARQLGWIV